MHVAYYIKDSFYVRLQARYNFCSGSDGCIIQIDIKYAFIYYTYKWYAFLAEIQKRLWKEQKIEW